MSWEELSATIGAALADARKVQDDASLGRALRRDRAALAELRLFAGLAAQGAEDGRWLKAA